jgi:hypothetical protein
VLTAKKSPPTFLSPSVVLRNGCRLANLLLFSDVTFDDGRVLQRLPDKLRKKLHLTTKPVYTTADAAYPGRAWKDQAFRLVADDLYEFANLYRLLCASPTVDVILVARDHYQRVINVLRPAMGDPAAKHLPFPKLRFPVFDDSKTAARADVFGWDWDV